MQATSPAPEGPLLRDDERGVKLVGADLTNRDPDASLKAHAMPNARRNDQPADPKAELSVFPTMPQRGFEPEYRGFSWLGGASHPMEST